MERRILGVSWRDRKTNSWVRTQTRCKDLTQTVKVPLVTLHCLGQISLHPLCVLTQLLVFLSLQLTPRIFLSILWVEEPMRIKNFVWKPTSLFEQEYGDNSWLSGTLALHKKITPFPTRLGPAWKIEQSHTHACFADDFLSMSTQRKFVSFDFNTNSIFDFTYLPKSNYDAWKNFIMKNAFVYKNNIYYAKSFKDAKIKTFIQITNNGKDGVIFNGVPDWLYEEDVLYTNNAIWFSPSGDKLLYASFDDTHVDEISFTTYGKEFSPEFTPKNDQFTYRYPKAGTTNPTVTLYVVLLGEKNEKIKKFQITRPSKIPKDHYYTSAAWISKDAVTITWKNRNQTMAIISICKEDKKWACETINGLPWVQLKKPLFDEGGMKYFLPLAYTVNDKFGDHQNVAKFNIQTKKLIHLTKKRFVVQEILAYSKDEKKIYFISTLVGDAYSTHLFSVKDGNEASEPDCLSCQHGKGCAVVKASFSKDLKYYILTCEGPDVPTAYLYKTRNNKLIKTLGDNTDFKEKRKLYSIPKLERMEVKITDTFSATATLRIPSSVDMNNNTKKYPLLLMVYGGPSYQRGTLKYVDHRWEVYLASQYDYVIATVDGRGSGDLSDQVVGKIYKSFGTYEIQDQIKVTEAAIKKYDFIDPEKVAVYGWSYGGFSALQMLMQDQNNTFKCGVAVAPVTNWKHYDSSYTERYMQSPSANPHGYKNSDIVANARKLTGKDFLLVHGTADGGSSRGQRSAYDELHSFRSFSKQQAK
ncbi:Prolyl endopeptidase FAP [Nymphon striatum]|nr:Prolyl endopeptidase FAP [Nymphon striatum]